jgi:hypothetical protein
VKPKIVRISTELRAFGDPDTMTVVPTRILATALVLAVVVFGSAPARAADDAEKARQLFNQGSKHYDLGQFDKAIEAWQQGYDQKPDPGFLYNIAQAYRQKQDAQRAIFFYKGYLRNSPKAHNRAEVEQKIAALQKQADQASTPPPAAPTTPPTTPPTVTTPPLPATTTSPPIAQHDATTAPPGPGATEPPPTGFSDPAPAATATLPGTTAADGFAPPRRIDLRGAIGTDIWSTGVNGTADPSFAFTLGAGYTFGSPASRLRFRLGAIFGYTFLAANSDQSKVTFVSFLIDPTLEVRITPRWFGYVDLGIGFVALAGLKPGSTLLQPGGQMLGVDGTPSLPETRVGLALEFRIRPDLAVYASPTIINSPKREHFFAAISRLELLAGLTYRL